MASEHRQPEVAHFAKWYAENGFDVIAILIHLLSLKAWVMQLASETSTIVHWIRFSNEIGCSATCQCIQCDVAGLELINAHFYHLDTALSVIDEKTALYVLQPLPRRVRLF